MANLEIRKSRLFHYEIADATLFRYFLDMFFLLKLVYHESIKKHNNKQ